MRLHKLSSMILAATVVLGLLGGRSALAVTYTAIDLNPSGFTTSFGNGIHGARQVGYGLGTATGGDLHALLWSGTSGSMVDLHQFFADGFSSSQANAIDALGNIVGYATDTSGHTHAILWQPVHEPGTLSLLGILGICLSGYGWRRRKH